MKKLLLLLVLLISFAMTWAQNVPRKMVTLEIETSTLCYYCPGAAKGADDMITNGKQVAVIENHCNGLGTDPYSNVDARSRETLFNAPGYPTSTFDGISGIVGGHHTNSQYTQFLAKYNARIGVTSPIDMSMTFTNNGLHYDITVTVTKVGTISGGNLKLFFFITQSNIAYNWQGMTKLHFVNRKMLPDKNGLSVDFTSGNTQVYNLSVDMQASWVLSNCEFVATVQNIDPAQGTFTSNGYQVNKREEIQSIKSGVIPLSVDFTADADTVGLNEPVHFSKIVSGGYVNAPQSYQWLFPGGNPATSTDSMPTVIYTEYGSHDVTLIVNRGGEIDTLVKPGYIYVQPSSPYLTVEPPNQNVPATPSGTTTFTVASNAAWTTTCLETWCTVTPSGFGNGIIYADYAENTELVQRVAYITVAIEGASPVTVSVTQAPASLGHRLDGALTYANTQATPLSGITVNLKNAGGTLIGTTQTDGVGYFAFPDLSDGNYTLEMASTKTWGGVTALDVLLYKKHIANIAFLYGIFLSSGDVNASGTLTAADVLLVKKRIGALINSFAVGDWLYNNLPVTINGSNVSVFFNGLCYGDANGSYTPPAKIAVIPQQIPQDGRLVIGDIPENSTGNVTVPVYASTINEVGAFQFTIDYNPQLMTFAGTSGWYPGINGVTEGEPAPGHLTFVWAADDRGITIDDGILFNIEFRMINTSSESAISWADTPTVREFAGWNGDIFTPSFENGTLKGANPVDPSGLQPFVTAFPNPATGYIYVKSDCPILKIDVLSMVNQVMYTLNDVGSAQTRLDLTSLRSGLYFVRVTTTLGDQVVRVTLTK